MVFKPGHKPEKNNKQQKYSAWSFGKWIRNNLMEDIKAKAVELLHSEDEAIALGMWKELVNRGVGKVPDQIEMAGPMGGPLKISFEAVVPVKQQTVIELDEQSAKPVLSMAKTARGIRE